MPTSTPCKYTSGTGRACKNEVAAAAGFCKHHLCGVVGCTHAKPSKATHCQMHSAEFESSI